MLQQQFSGIMADMKPLKHAIPGENVMQLCQPHIATRTLRLLSKLSMSNHNSSMMM